MEAIPVLKLADAADVLGISVRAAESALRHAGIRSGYPAAAVHQLAASRPGRGARTDLKGKGMGPDMYSHRLDSDFGTQALADRVLAYIDGEEFPNEQREQDVTRALTSAIHQGFETRLGERVTWTPATNDLWWPADLGDDLRGMDLSVEALKPLLDEAADEVFGRYDEIVAGLDQVEV